ncbi:unnamed protein product [Didymodactylos carnosus]|uniref:F-box domain-containing protein n=1 Tax=Didymodactylos carnosus TaxID=1234261 RepID=A0A814CVL0_9BILA|nr:unnamed protein product [Didymodactylos carnosus]CAF0944983.1 unnamed protein product [Didymodactylos carnosus]CAF3661286.1 unnamed protein product [Didymodactylos carnosus]CAF3721228.1 unnamed protein product [Didymodactylos carnosus]
MTTSTILNLASELLYQIFDYLDGIHIYMAFYGWSFRLNCLIDTIYQLHFDFTNIPLGKFIDYCQSVLPVISKKLVAIKLTTENNQLQQFMLRFRLHQFSRLHSFTLIGVFCDKTITNVVEYLSTSKQLKSLVIQTIYNRSQASIDISNTLRSVIYHLPFLNNLTLATNEKQLVFINDRFTLSSSRTSSNCLQLLTLHLCCATDLFKILVYLPNIKHITLTFCELPSRISSAILIVPSLCTLNLSSPENKLPFDYIIYLFKCFPNLNKFSLTTDNEQFVDGEQWQQLLSQLLQDLQKFRLLVKNVEYSCQQDIKTSFSTSYWLSKHCQLNFIDMKDEKKRVNVNISYSNVKKAR